jgi:hypothetical protein
MGQGRATAKGLDDAHAKVTISGPGLAGGIVTLGADGASFVSGSEPWADKWDAPNIGGSLRPDGDLGPVYDVHVVLDCRPEGRTRYHQTLYPNAPEGPQLFTPEGVEACGAPAQPGFDPIGPSLQALLRSHGVTFDPLDLATHVSPAALRTDSGSSRVVRTLVLAILVILGAAAVAILVRRRRALG